MKRIPLKKDPQTGQIHMTIQNLKICARNQQGYQTLYLNDSLQLQYYNFTQIVNLQQCICIQKVDLSQQQSNQNQQANQVKGVNTLFLNNNLILKIQNLQSLSKTLVTLNLAHNQIMEFSGLKQLINLAVLDLSYNKIRSISKQQISPLQNLKRLNLNSNLLATQQSIQSVVQLKNSLETLQLCSNQSFLSQINILTQVFGQMTQLKVLMMKDTPFVRTTSAYRKQIILAATKLTFLDERPVTQDQRFLANAWKRGGLKEQQNARKMIRQKKQQKNQNILKEMQQRTKIADIKADKVFYKKAKDLISELQKLKVYIKSQDFELLTSQQQSIIKLKIQQLERYLQLLRQECKGLDLDEQLGIKKDQLPRMLVQKRTSQCIYIYNVKQCQLERIKQKYYPQEILPLKVVNYQKTEQIYWLREYNQILQRLYRLCKGDWQHILLEFNIEIYEYDLNIGRKLRRFSQQQLKKYFKQINNSNMVQKYSDSNYTNVNQLKVQNQLDCLD